MSRFELVLFGLFIYYKIPTEVEKPVLIFGQSSSEIDPQIVPTIIAFMFLIFGIYTALYEKDSCEMGAILVDSATHIIKKIKRVEIEEMFVERMVMSWNPFRGTGDQYTKSFDDETFNKKVAEIFKMKSTKEMWTSSW